MVDEALRDPISVAMLKIDGAKIVEIGERPGPRIGYILHALLEEVLDDPKKNTEEYWDKKAVELSKMKDDELKRKEKRRKIEKKGRRGRGEGDNGPSITFHRTSGRGSRLSRLEKLAHLRNTKGCEWELRQFSSKKPVPATYRRLVSVFFSAQAEKKKPPNEAIRFLYFRSPPSGGFSGASLFSKNWKAYVTMYGGSQSTSEDAVIYV